MFPAALELIRRRVGCHGSLLALFQDYVIFGVLEIVDHFINLVDEVRLPHRLIDLIQFNEAVGEVLLEHWDAKAFLSFHGVLDLF